MSVWQTVSFVMMAHLLACISPGPDFAVITRNTLAYSRRIGFFTTLGCGCGILMHTTYCALGLAALLIKFPHVFLIVRYIGGAYLSYLGLKALLSSASSQLNVVAQKQTSISTKTALRQGFLVNALNPKCIFFTFSLFIMIAKLKSAAWSIFFVIEMSLTTILWFSFVVYLFSHARVKPSLMRFQTPITKGLGVFLVIIGVQLILGGS